MSQASEIHPQGAPAPTSSGTSPGRGGLGARVSDLLQNRHLGWVAFAVALLAPFVIATPYAMGVMTTAAIFVMLAVGLNIVVGYCGLLDLGYVAFFAVGAYTAGVLTTRLDLPLLAAVPAVLVTSALAAIIIGLPTLRLRSDYLAIVTLGFGEIIRLTANNLDLTGGPSGLFGIPDLMIGSLDLGGPVPYYYVTVLVVSLAVLGSARLARSRMGRAWHFIREDEDAAEAMGVNTYTTKLAAYVVGGIWGGLAGVLFAGHLSAVSPQSFIFLQSALVLMAVVLGGMGNARGVVLGAVFISLLPELMRDFAEYRYFLFGVLLIAVMVWRPQGLWQVRAQEPERAEDPSAPQGPRRGEVPA